MITMARSGAGQWGYKPLAGKAAQPPKSARSSRVHTSGILRLATARARAAGVKRGSLLLIRTVARPASSAPSIITTVIQAAHLYSSAARIRSGMIGALVAQGME